jgi:hypothetical protein
VRYSITSRNSPLGSASAPSAEPPSCCTQAPNHRARGIEGQVISKNFGTAGITCHSDPVWIPVWTTCGQPSDYPALPSQRRPFPQFVRLHRATFHKPPTIRHTWHAGITRGYPQCPQPLILLLVYLRSFFFEEGTWGHLDSLSAEPVCDLPCHPDRLAFKLSWKALRWFIDSRYGRRTHRGDAS